MHQLMPIEAVEQCIELPPTPILQAIEAYAENGPGSIVRAWGQAPAPTGATISNSTRLVLGIEGRNCMLLPQGEAVCTQTLLTGDCCLIHRHAWNMPLHRYRKCFVTLDWKPTWLRCYIRRTTAAGSLPAQGWQSLVGREAGGIDQELLRAAEHLLPRADRDELLRDLIRALIRQARYDMQTRRPAHATNPTWLRIRDWLDEHLHETIDRSDLARACDIHPNHVSRLFRLHADTSFVEYLRQLRLDRARVLLEHPDLRIATIASRCGFSSPEYFCRIFKRATGSSPGRWRLSRDTS